MNPGSRIAALPAHLRKRLADAFETGMLTEVCSPAALRSVLGARESIDELLTDLTELAHLGISGRAVTAWLRTVDQARSQMLMPDLVWSGPEVAGLHARDTRRVYEELLRDAQRSVWMSTYAYFDGRRAFADIADRLDATPSLQVTLLLNLQRSRGDTTAPDHLVRKFTDRFWRTDWPGEARPAVFFDPRSLDIDGPTGVLHAKAVVVDDDSVFVTSANLTEAAFDRNIELGVLMRDRMLAASITRHFQGLIDHELLQALPES